MKLPSRVLLAGALSLLAAPGSPAQLYPGEVFPTPDMTGDTRFVSGDLNGDGHTDVVLRLVGDRFLVMLSDGAGGVIPLPDVPAAGSYPRLLADLTDDGLPDLVAVTISTSNSVRVFPGDGAGGLGAPVSYAVGSQHPREAGAADVNGDGHTDLVYIGSFLSGLVVLLADGAGGLAPPTGFPVSLSSANLMKLADLDEDGHVDALVSSFAGCCHDVEVLLGAGDGSFASAGMHPIAVANVRTMQVGDLNGDGHVDVVTTNSVSPSSTPEPVAILYGDGNGGLAAPVYFSWPEAPDSWQFDLHDLEPDGDLDLLLSDIIADGTVAALNDGLGSFGVPGYVLPPGSVVLGSFDAEAPVDAALLYTADAAGGLSIHRGLEGGGFEALARYDAGPNADDLVIGDLDGDGALDVVRDASAALYVQLGDGAGGLLPAATIAVAMGQNRLALGDLDGDGVLDLVTSNPSSDKVAVLLGDGAGDFAAPVQHATSIDPQDLGLADFDSDGDLDVVVAAGSSALPVVVVMAGDGAGGLSTLSLTGPAKYFEELDVADVDHDGDPDVVGATTTGVVVLRGNGAGGFASSTSYPYGGEAIDVVFADLDLDGHRDVAATNFDGTWARLMGDGLGGFGPPIVASGGNGHQSRSIRVADVSGDGWPDVVTSRTTQNRIMVLLGDGAGSFALESAGYATGKGPASIAVVDVDGDARPDVLGAGFTYTSVMLNILEPFVWRDLGAALPGAVEAPTLSAHGTLAPASTVSLKLVNAKPLSAAYLIGSPFQLGQPFKGGVLVPFPSIVIPLGTNASGGFALSGSAPAHLPPGFTWYLQVWVVDPSGPAGLTASNALSGTTP